MDELVAWGEGIELESFLQTASLVTLALALVGFGFRSGRILSRQMDLLVRMDERLGNLERLHTPEKANGAGFGTGWLRPVLSDIREDQKQHIKETTEARREVREKLEHIERTEEQTHDRIARELRDMKAKT